MAETQDMTLELEEDFLNLLLEADPQIANHADFAKEFARHLVDFADIWATNPESIADYEQWLINWVESYDEYSLTDDIPEPADYFNEKDSDAEQMSVVNAGDSADYFKEDDEEDEEASASS